MAYDDNFLHRARFLLKNPKNGFTKIVPFIKSRLKPVLRRVVERVGVERFSTPYSGHKEFSKHIDYRNGFFVLCGGNDGFGNDPTYYLERFRGWKGIIVEPLPIYKLCQKNRPSSHVYNCAVGEFGHEGTVRLIDCNAMSFVAGTIDNSKEWIARAEKVERITSREIDVSIKPVQKLIDDYFTSNKKRNIDILVVDVEGSELSVLKGLDFVKNKPTYVLIEAHSNDRLDVLAEYLEEKGYSLVGKIGDSDFLFN